MELGSHRDARCVVSKLITSEEVWGWWRRRLLGRHHAHRSPHRRCHLWDLRDLSLTHALTFTLTLTLTLLLSRSFFCSFRERGNDPLANKTFDVLTLRNRLAVDRMASYQPASLPPSPRSQAHNLPLSCRNPWCAPQTRLLADVCKTSTARAGNCIYVYIHIQIYIYIYICIHTYIYIYIYR